MTNITTLAVNTNNMLLFSNGTLGVKTLIYSTGSSPLAMASARRTLLRRAAPARPSQTC